MEFLYAGFVFLFFLAGCWFGYLYGYERAQEEHLRECDEFIHAGKSQP